MEDISQVQEQQLAQAKSTGTSNINYIIEHFETEVSQWTLCEYTHMILILSDLYSDPKSLSTDTLPASGEGSSLSYASTLTNRLIITNFPFVQSAREGKLEEDEYSTKKNTEKLLRINENLRHKALFSKYATLELTTQEKMKEIKQQASATPEMFKDDTLEIIKLFQQMDSGIRPTSDEQSNVCFMDMRGTETLKPQDASKFNFIVFGGILGDHPPKDRAGDMRANFANVRQLGVVQMTTDTALLVSREILEEQKNLSDLAFITDPEIPTDDAIKTYLDLRMPLDSLVEDKFQLKTSSSQTPLRDLRQHMVTV